MNDCPHKFVYVLTGCCTRCGVQTDFGRRLIGLAFTPTEVAACVTFGSDRYASDAMIRDQEREAALDAEMEAERVALGAWYDWRRPSDEEGISDAVQREYDAKREAFVTLRRSRYRAMLPGEGLSDWAAAMGLSSPKEGGWKNREDWLAAVQLEHDTHAPGGTEGPGVVGVEP